MENDNHFNFLKKSRQRKKPQNRWTRDQTFNLLTAIADKLKDDPLKFEKPTASQFYTSLFDDYCLRDLERLGAVVVKHKVRNLKDSFLKAEEWREQNAIGILEEGKDDDIKEYISRICPHYEILKRIFGHRKKVNLPAIYIPEDTTRAESFFNSRNIKIPYEMESEDTFRMEDASSTGGGGGGGGRSDKNDRVEQIEQINQGTSNEATERLNDNVLQSSPFKSLGNRFKISLKKPRNGDRNKRQISSTLQYLTMLQNKDEQSRKKKIQRRIVAEENHLKVEKGKLQMELKKIQLQNEMDAKKLEFEREKFRAECELKRFEIEKNFELKKFELELKYKNKDN